MNHPSRAIPLIAIGALLLLPDAFAQSNLTPMQRRLASGFVSHELDERAAAKAPAVISPLGVSGVSGASGVNAPLAPSGANAPLAGPPTSYVPSGKNACQQTFGPNVKVNQNCLNLSDADLQGRGQAQNETAIAADPNHPNHLVAAFNDYRRGDGTCGFAFSLDGGQHWNDALAPVGFTRGSPGFARQYWQANGDPSVAWDTRGNAYLACQSFDRGTPSSQDTDTSSAVYVFRSTQNSGASWNFPGRPATEFFDPAGTGSVLEDKPYMTVDSQVGSPFQDRIYVTWTEFAADGSGYIYEVHSSDYGETFSPRVLVSKDSPVCFNTFGAGTPEGKCNENQDSQPFTGPDGAL
ncbi:MAG TPA: hypothetical protein VEV18_00780, partial [Steroidobacteraceae bacterium]|nr:hypothetical protein [Steroidobacteraceae bacterium]